MSGWTMGTEAWIWMGAWALIMGLVVWLLVREPRRGTLADPAAILRDRFARGEITEAEYRQAMSALDDGLPTSHGGATHDASHHARQGQKANHD